MGADEAGFSPPMPSLEPTRSPELEILGHDDRGWKADMMSALGDSVSFGRFLNEPLEWGKCSAFEHKRYLEEAEGQSRPGSVAQKKAFFDAHYARKLKSDADEDAEDDDECDIGPGIANHGVAACSARSSCMTDEPSWEEIRSVYSDAMSCGGIVDAEPMEAFGEVKAVKDCVGPSYMFGGTDERSDKQEDEARKELRFDNGDTVVVADAVDKQPLQEISIVNRGITDSVKKRRVPLSSLLDKSSSPPSVKKGLSWSAQRRPMLHSAKENSLLFPSTDSNKQASTSVPQNQKRTTLDTLHMSMNSRRSETGNSASRSRNLGSTIAARISQLESANRPVKDTHPKVNQHRPARKGFCKGMPDIAIRTSQLEEKRSSHANVTTVKEMLFGSTSSPVHQKTDKTNGNVIAQEMLNLGKIDHHLLTDAGHPHRSSKGSSKDKHTSCFPFRLMC